VSSINFNFFQPILCNRNQMISFQSTGP